MTKHIVDLTGQKFGLLLVLRHQGKNKHGKNLWLCACECGRDNSIKTVEQGKLLRKNFPTRSCGCLVKKHGHAGKTGRSGTYKSWESMLARCFSEKSASYKDYGQRGITVCDKWNPAKGGSFCNFLSDMGERPKGMTLERIDVNKNYTPDNCKWATMKEQASNRRNTFMLAFMGKTQSFMAWAEETGIPYATLKKRICAYGWSAERALTTSNTTKKQSKSSDVIVSFNGESLCLSEWARKYDISATTIRNRLRAGWSAEKAIKTPPMR